MKRTWKEEAKWRETHYEVFIRETELFCHKAPVIDPGADPSGDPALIKRQRLWIAESGPKGIHHGRSWELFPWEEKQNES